MIKFIEKHYKKAVASICSLIMLLPYFSVPVLADASNLILTKNYFTSYTSTLSSANYPYLQYYVSTGTNDNSNTRLPFQVFKYIPYNSNSVFFVFWLTDSQFNDVNNGGSVYLLRYWSTNGNIYSLNGSAAINNTYTGNDVSTGTTGTTLHYLSSSATSDTAGGFVRKNMIIENCPTVYLSNGTTYQDILYYISLNKSGPYPWDGTTSSGGRYWSDGTELNAENTAKYENIYIVMDSNNDNSVSEEEVNYYNYTYNTNYDYSEVNEGNNFTEDQFLYWVATVINGGNDNPGGGTGSGSNGSSSGGISIGDGSFTQSQTQSIAENAVNVEVNNNNAITSENVQWIDSIINNNTGSEEDNPFEEAISNMSLFTSVARGFASLAGVVFGWLPWWVTALFSLLMTLLFVMVVFRLIHLFI